jgi:valyl-tRNA synthetase
MNIEDQGALIQHIIHAVRLLLNKYKFGNPVNLTICCDILKALVIYNWNHKGAIEKLLHVKIIYAGETAPSINNAVRTIVDGCELIMSPTIIDSEKVISQYKKELENCYKFRASKLSKLNNLEFRHKAPLKIVQHEEELCIELERRIQILKTQITELENND